MTPDPSIFFLILSVLEQNKTNTVFLSSLFFKYMMELQTLNKGTRTLKLFWRMKIFMCSGWVRKTWDENNSLVSPPNNMHFAFFL